MLNTVKIKITNIERPDFFYFRFFVDTKDQEIAKKRYLDVERRIQQLAKHDECTNDVEIGLIYAIHLSHWGKWVRARTVSKAHSGYYNVFLIDHGFFKHSKQFFVIPESLQEDSNYISKGSLEVLPLYKKWDDEAIKICNELNLVKDSAEIHFISSRKDANDVYFGDLFVNTKSEKYSMIEKLISQGVAKKSSFNFKDIYNEFSKNDAENSQIYKNPKQRLEIFSRDAAKKSTKILTQESSILPHNLIIQGKNLKAPWKLSSEVKFHSLINQQVTKTQLSNETISYMWPQITAQKNAMIITSNQDDLTLSYLLPILSNICKSREGGTAELMGPIAIIFAHNIYKVDEIAKQCQEFSRNLRIIKAHGMCQDKKFLLISDCDLLITTPPAYSRLTKNIAIDIIDRNRLKHVVFDCFDQMWRKFEHDIHVFLQFCYAKKDKIPQIITTSGILSDDMKKKVLKHLPKDSTVLCTDNFFEATVYAGINATIEISSSIEQKIDIICKSLNSNDKKTLIVVSDKETANFLHNELSLKDIKAQTGSIGNIDVAKKWEENHENNGILIVTDETLRDVDIKSVCNLINFSFATNWMIFTKRFKSFTNAIYDKLNGTNKNLTLACKIFLNDEDINEYEAIISFFIAHKLIDSKDCPIENIRNMCESVKCKLNVSLCKKLLQFGKCTKPNCSNRHILSPRDKSSDYLPRENYIKFKIYHVETPTSFVIKVEEIFKDGQWHSMEEKNKFIESFLKNDFQEYCNKKENHLSDEEGKIGGIYAKYDESLKQWIRVKIIERTSSKIVETYPIDIWVESSKVLERKLLHLPERFTKVDPQTCQLQILNLIPIDKENSYDYIDFEKLKKMLKLKSIYICKIQTAIGETLLTKTFEMKSDAGRIKFQLKNSLLNMGICDVDESIAVEINKLVSAINPKKSTSTSKPSMCLPNLITNENKSLDFYSWKELKCGKSYQVSIHHYESPYSFIVILDNPENLTLKNNLKDIEDSSNTKLLENLEIGTICMIDNNGMKRGKILSSKEDGSCDVFLVDYGLILKCNRNELFDIPKEFKSLQFQAIHCSMLGIRPKFNMNFWPSLPCKRIETLIQEYNDGLLTIRVARNDTKKNTFNDLGISCYDAFLCDIETGDYLNEIAVNRMFADKDDSVDDFIDSSDDDDYEDNLHDYYDSSEEEEDSFESKELEKLRKYAKEIEDSESTTTSSIDTTNLEVISSSKSEASLVSSFTNITTSSLKYIYQHPKIEWRDNDFMIYLLVSACDCKDYGLIVKENSFDIAISYNEYKNERIIITLYGLIQVEMCSHELNGKNIVVRLIKRKLGKWPRLTKDLEKKSHYIKFSSDSVPFNCFNSNDNNNFYEPIKGVRCIPESDYEDYDEDNEMEAKLFSTDEDD